MIQERDDKPQEVSLINVLMASPMLLCLMPEGEFIHPAI